MRRGELLLFIAGFYVVATASKYLLVQVEETKDDYAVDDTALNSNIAARKSKKETEII